MFRRREVLELARRNPYSYTLKPRLGTALQLLDATDYVTRWVESSGIMRLWFIQRALVGNHHVPHGIHRRMGDFAHPMLVLQGMADAITDPQLAKEFHDRAASEVCV